ncbi:PREDICTED: ubiquitin carboxyl-terminal hydrolase 48-like [Priapulus caudatus]|uniref:ubiquitinyl hydrolase 1 n=1 Tax=Priapulus caudatus TaxID=37621 RepID=A0ABM1FB94_PRICU|nr:PREDICTED: ubiquitin carboxyl-terminal hydrolase 48-like [Priapulus caudatus]
MPSKQQLDKAAWQWAETTDPSCQANVTDQHVRISYKLTVKPCKQGTCRRNCRGSPRCLNALGESVWMGEIDEKKFSDIEDPDEERRKKGAFVGLKNLGATCYVNSLLQLWFHNPNFRLAVYRWRPMEENVCTDDAVDNWKPSSICEHLQGIFALLELSERRYIDPGEFVTSLGLDTGLQQDVQEFSKLLGNRLQDHANPQVIDVICDQFQGTYSYVTTCKGCGGSSDTPSKFYELDLNIKGHKTLHGCIEEFLQEEELGRVTTVSLAVCCNSRDLIFDRATGQKKKLNSCIQFPDVLDMSQCIGEAEQTSVYDLTAVLIHRGMSAYAGHYIAHIKEASSATWYKFNDEVIEKMKGKNLQLYQDEDEIGRPDWNAKKMRGVKGILTSKDAYMLAYTRRKSTNVEEPLVEVVSAVDALPDRVKIYVSKDNSNFDAWMKEMKAMKDKNVTSGLAKQMQVREMYNLLQDKDEVLPDWIAAQWISDWLANPDAERSVDNSALLCSHGKLSPDEIVKAKCISSEGAAVIYAKFGGGPRLAGDVLCRECVIERCQSIHVKAKVATDSKTITALLKRTCSSTKQFWVGKTSLRSWRCLVLQHYGSSIQDNCGAEGSGNSENKQEQQQQQEQAEAQSSNEKIERQHSLEMDANDGSAHPENETTSISSVDDRLQGFNEDLLCSGHRRLCVQENRRKLVSIDVWSRLKGYFPDAPEFSASAPVCEKCLRTCEEAQEQKAVHRTKATEQKQLLSDLYADRNRPSWDSTTTNQLYLVSRDFVNEWRRFIKEPLRWNPVSSLSNEPLLCAHGKLLVQPASSMADVDTDLFLYVWPKEWQTVRQQFAFDVEVEVCRLEDKGGLTFYTNPDVCDECRMARQQQLMQEKCDFVNERIYIRRLTSDHEEEETLGTEYQTEQTVEAPALIDVNVRRSSRTRRSRNDKEVIISSSDTLRDLKVKIMKLFSVPPFDQHLAFNGVQLTDEYAKLGNLRLSPGCMLTLKVDEPTDDQRIVIDDLPQASTPETGFKGTGLLGH